MGKTKEQHALKDAWMQKNLTFSRERQYDECQREVLEKSGKGGGVSQRTKSEGSYKVGPNQSIGFQKSKGISGRAEGDKQVTLWDLKKGVWAIK